ncbi:MAG TPA: DUF2834 domain-containing protein [Candidatus Binatia bacterium]|nr:DUF2834 domain-containing protein [Candidatus Binatia bacterium]
MNAKQIGIGVVLADFLALNAYVVYQYGYVGFLELVTANAATAAALVDLVIALSLVTIWMVRDARERGVSSIPYVILTVVLGSVGPLLYLFRRAGSEKVVRARVVTAAARG